MILKINFNDNNLNKNIKTKLNFLILIKYFLLLGL